MESVQELKRKQMGVNLKKPTRRKRQNRSRVRGNETGNLFSKIYQIKKCEKILNFFLKIF